MIGWFELSNHGTASFFLHYMTFVLQYFALQNGSKEERKMCVFPFSLLNNLVIPWPYLSAADLALRVSEEVYESDHPN